jgi:transposase
MLSLSPHSRIWLCTRPADMRKSFDGLCGLVRQWLKADPLSGEIFVFRNKGGDRVKILTWLPGGLAIWYKRLEAGTFRFPESGSDESHCKVGVTELYMLLEGIELEHVKRRKRYQPPPPIA